MKGILGILLLAGMLAAAWTVEIPMLCSSGVCTGELNTTKKETHAADITFSGIHSTGWSTAYLAGRNGHSQEDKSGSYQYRIGGLSSISSGLLVIKGNFEDGKTTAKVQFYQGSGGSAQTVSAAPRPDYCYPRYLWANHMCAVDAADRPVKITEAELEIR